jgi:hypothetical protein
MVRRRKRDPYVGRGVSGGENFYLVNSYKQNFEPNANKRKSELDQSFLHNPHLL